ncbi:TonB-dependent receptor [Allosphingosinicella vermicomposti]|uniref:TonB-dependent receptor n=1 Tax=Allosphingosinicella vermicomposti TaxID=614671 RepID=UPI000D108DFA|nr:TonB-dependent receptor [Allosphingosinicella vermicomposti]
MPAFLALSCVTFAAPAFAADGESTIARDTDDQSIIVTGEREAKELESPKALQPLVDTPQTVTVISDQTLRKQNLLTLRDALSTIPGITFGAGEGGGGYGDSINLRGYSANNDVTQDGVRDSAQYSRTDPFNLQQIEVYNGANSVFNGAGSVGGTINLVSKVPQAENLTILQASVGTDNYLRGTIDTNHRLSEFIAVRLNAMGHKADAPGRDVEKYQRYGFAPAITLGIDGPTSLTLAYLHQRDDNTPVYGVPYYAVAGGPLDGVDDSDYFGIENLDSQKTEVDRLTATFTHDFSDSLTVRNLTRWQRVFQPTVTSAPQASGAGAWCLSNGTNQLGAPCATGQQPGFYYPSGPRGLVRDQTNDLLYNQTDLRFTAANNTLVVGASFAQEDYTLVTAQLLRDANGAVLPQPPIEIADPDTNWRGPVNRIVTGKSYGDSRNAAVYAFDTLELGRFELNAGLRYESVRNLFRADTYATPGAYGRGADQVSKESLFSYRAGLVFKPTDWSSLYISYANAKTPSSASVRGGCTSGSGATFSDFCDAAPETARNFEIGGKADLMRGRLQLTAALFRNERSNFRVPSQDPAAPTLQVLDGRSRVDGIALGVTGNITPAWSVFANYTYLDSEVLQSVSDFCLDNPGTACGNSASVIDPQRGNDLQQTPKHSGSLFMTYTFPFGLQLGYGFTYQGSFALNQSTLAAPQEFRSDDWMTHRAFASYPFGNGLTAQLNVQNITNERYFTGIRNNGWATPGEDRSAVLSLFYSF